MLIAAALEQDLKENYAAAFLNVKLQKDSVGRISPLKD
jgi:hypothetical protein